MQKVSVWKSLCRGYKIDISTRPTLKSKWTAHSWMWISAHLFNRLVTQHGKVFESCVKFQTWQLHSSAWNQLKINVYLKRTAKMSTKILICTMCWSITPSLKRHFFYLLDYVNRRSEKLEFVKKKLVWRQLCKKYLHFCFNEKLYLATFVQFFTNILYNINNLVVMQHQKIMVHNDIFPHAIFIWSPIWKFSVWCNLTQQIKKYSLKIYKKVKVFFDNFSFMAQVNLTGERYCIRGQIFLQARKDIKTKYNQVVSRRLIINISIKQPSGLGCIMSLVWL